MVDFKFDALYTGRRITSEVLSFSKLTLELALQLSLADQTTSRIATELGKKKKELWSSA